MGRYDATSVFEHDFAGYRKCRRLEFAKLDICADVPDLVGEVASENWGDSGSTAAEEEQSDAAQKMMLLPKYGIPHFWLVWCQLDKVRACKCQFSS